MSSSVTFGSSAMASADRTPSPIVTTARDRKVDERMVGSLQMIGEYSSESFDFNEDTEPRGLRERKRDFATDWSFRLKRWFEFFDLALKSGKVNHRDRPALVKPGSVAAVGAEVGGAGAAEVGVHELHPGAQICS